MSSIPTSWLPLVPMKRYHGHWTAGAHRASPVDVKAYHLLWEGDGTVVRGVDIVKNSGRLKDGYAAHTLNANTDAIGGAMCGMTGAVENPFNPGSAPLTLVQWNSFVRGSAQVIDYYNIPIGLKTTLFHAEVGANLGIAQRGKWDVSVLPFDTSVKGAKNIGDKWRDEMRAFISGTTPVVEPIPAGGVARVTTNGLNLRRGPAISYESRGQLPEGTLLEVFASQGEWVSVKTPAGYEGWVNRNYILMIDGPAPVEPTKPDPKRLIIQSLREQLDELESLL